MFFVYILNMLGIIHLMWICPFLILAWFSLPIYFCTYCCLGTRLHCWNLCAKHTRHNFMAAADSVVVLFAGFLRDITSWSFKTRFYSAKLQNSFNIFFKNLNSPQCCNKKITRKTKKSVSDFQLWTPLPSPPSKKSH